MRGSCDCAQDDTWLAQGDDMVVVRTGWHSVGAARWPGRRARSQALTRAHQGLLRANRAVILRAAKRRRRIQLSRGARLGMRGSCDCAQDDTWLAQGDDANVAHTGWHLVGAERWRGRRARRMTPGWRRAMTWSSCAQDDTRLAQRDGPKAPRVRFSPDPARGGTFRCWTEIQLA